MIFEKILIKKDSNTDEEKVGSMLQNLSNQSFFDSLLNFGELFSNPFPKTSKNI